jgi:hypothetical protein
VSEIHAKNVPPCVSVYAEFVFLGMFVFEIHTKNVSPSVLQFTLSLCSWECSCSRYMLIMCLHLCFSLRRVCVPGNVRVRDGNPHVCLGSRPLLLFCLQPVSTYTD